MDETQVEALMTEVSSLASDERTTNGLPVKQSVESEGITIEYSPRRMPVQTPQGGQEQSVGVVSPEESQAHVSENNNKSEADEEVKQQQEDQPHSPATAGHTLLETFDSLSEQAPDEVDTKEAYDFGNGVHLDYDEERDEDEEDVWGIRKQIEILSHSVQEKTTKAPKLEIPSSDEEEPFADVRLPKGKGTKKNSSSKGGNGTTFGSGSEGSATNGDNTMSNKNASHTTNDERRRNSATSKVIRSLRMRSTPIEGRESEKERHSKHSKHYYPAPSPANSPGAPTPPVADTGADRKRSLSVTSAVAQTSEKILKLRSSLRRKKRADKIPTSEVVCTLLQCVVTT